MVRRYRSGVYSFADFLELVQEDQKADLIDGAIYMASPESLDHNELVGWLFHLLDLYVQERKLGRVTINKVAFRLAPTTSPEPDLAFVPQARLNTIKHGYVDGPPDLAVEIVSPESVERDYELKRRAYEDAGVKEYWIIDPDERHATFLIREGDEFVEAKLNHDTFRSTVLPGFHLDIHWLWQRPLPEALRTVMTILGRA